MMKLVKSCVTDVFSMPCNPVRISTLIPASASRPTIGKAVMSIPAGHHLDGFASISLQGVRITLDESVSQTSRLLLQAVGSTISLSDSSWVAYSHCGDFSQSPSSIIVLCEHEWENGDNVWLATKFHLPEFAGEVTYLKFYHKLQQPVMSSASSNSSTSDVHLIIGTNPRGDSDSSKVIKIDIRRIPFRVLPIVSPDSYLPTRSTVDAAWPICESVLNMSSGMVCL